MSKAVTDLMNDHEAILSALNVFENILNKISKEKKVDIDDLLGFVDFLREFSDKCHHGKEEGILFPAMIACGIPDRGGPIGVMMADHIQARGYIFNLLEALEEPEDYGKFEKVGRSYIELLRVHIQKENNVLFPMAERAISSEQLDSIYQAFSELEEKVIGHGRHDELHSFLDDLKLKYTDKN
ncbi:MAG: hemerythrin [Chloroflexi bacterium HGW-Chloroflexi-4]|jgi:hemerythrin-like domain-containing protein|nr:MAG: hemerythrin [Chloroflexi bacterium HGW-Chloroflexi-4]